jgi:SulP family sulfate permease
MKMLRLEGSIFFGAVDHVQQALRRIDEADPALKHVMIFSRGINFIDLAGAEMLTREAIRRRRFGGNLFLCGVQRGFCDMLSGGGYVGDVGRENIFATKGEAIAAIYPRLDQEVCRTCTARVFRECRQRPSGSEKPAPAAPGPIVAGEAV